MESLTPVVLIAACIFLCLLLPWKRRGKQSGGRSDSASRLGELGENFIERELKRHYRKFPVLKNIYVPYMGKTAEIDLVLIHEKGIFIFESKNYGGWIYGALDQPYWMQSFPNGKKRQFYNPVMQNRTHINALSQYLNLPLHCFYSCIVFSDHCTFKKIPKNSSSVTITQYSGLLKQLRGTLSALPVNFGKEEVKEIGEKLSPLKSVSKRVKAQHIRNIIDAQSATVCPFCGAKLVKRKGSYGEFLACRNYPRCQFTRKIEE